jgi:hypothetical protein
MNDHPIPPSLNPLLPSRTTGREEGQGEEGWDGKNLTTYL